MDFSSISGVNAALEQAKKSNTSNASSSLQNSLGNISSDSSEAELKGIIKDFESYFVEQVIKEVKDSLTMEDKDKHDQTMNQYKDFFMDTAIENMADKLVDEVGENFTQQLYEQMRRNYNIGETE